MPESLFDWCIALAVAILLSGVLDAWVYFN